MRLVHTSLIVVLLFALNSFAAGAGDTLKEPFDTAIEEASKYELGGSDTAEPVDAAEMDGADSPSCGDKRYCKEMRTCSEAVHYLVDCGLERLDADNDGIPCESICGKTKATMSARLRAQPWSDTANSDPSEALALVPDADGGEFTCGKKRTCRQMDSCEEARFYLETCGVRSLDGNSDGVPCNGLCQ
jgi:hypothetical protein